MTTKTKATGTITKVAQIAKLELELELIQEKASERVRLYDEAADQISVRRFLSDEDESVMVRGCALRVNDGTNGAYLRFDALDCVDWNVFNPETKAYEKRFNEKRWFVTLAGLRGLQEAIGILFTNANDSEREARQRIAEDERSDEIRAKILELSK